MDWHLHAAFLLSWVLKALSSAGLSHSCNHPIAHTFTQLHQEQLSFPEDTGTWAEGDYEESGIDPPTLPFVDNLLSHLSHTVCFFKGKHLCQFLLMIQKLEISKLIKNNNDNNNAVC